MKKGGSCVVLQDHDCDLAGGPHLPRAKNKVTPVLRAKLRSYRVTDAPALDLVLQTETRFAYAGKFWSTSCSYF